MIRPARSKVTSRSIGVRDSYNEVVMPGAFADSLARHKREGSYPLMLWQHDTYEPIGVWDDLSDDGKGLYAKGKLLIEQNVPVRRQGLFAAQGRCRARHVHRLSRDRCRAVDEW
jgi:phage head maturation protease